MTAFFQGTPAVTREDRSCGDQHGECFWQAGRNQEREHRWSYFGCQNFVTDIRGNQRHHSRTNACVMLRGLSVGLLASAIAIAPLPTKAQDGTAEDLEDVMSISLKDVVNPTIGFQGVLQGAGTPNQAGVGAFFPLAIGDNHVWFLDALVNAHFGDREGYSSIINTDVAGGLSTSTRLGYRWLNSDRIWMYGVNAGYDSRSLKSGITDTGISVTNKKTVGFQQIALNAEAVSNGWAVNGYGLIPLGDVEQKLNNVYQGGALNTYGLDVGYFITPSLQASVGYYYQHREQEHVDGSGMRGRLVYAINQGLNTGINISYDEAFDTRISADLKIRFRVAGTTTQDKQVEQFPTIKHLNSKPGDRSIRVHDWQNFHYFDDDMNESENNLADQDYTCGGKGGFLGC